MLEMRWFDAKMYIPKDHEMIAYWITSPKRLLLFGEFIRKDPIEDSEYISYLEDRFCPGSRVIKLSDDNITHWTPFFDPFGERSYEKDMARYKKIGEEVD